MIEIESTQVNTIYAGDTQVIRAYAGSDLVFGSTPIVGTPWFYQANQNGTPIGAQTVIIPDNGNQTFSVSVDDSEASLTLTNVNNTAGAAQQVSIVVNDEPFLSSATWDVGDRSPYAMLTDDQCVSFAYSDNYTITSDRYPGAQWTLTDKSNGYEIGQTTRVYPTGQDVSWPSGAQKDGVTYTSKLIIHSVDNTAGASQTVSIYVNEELKVDHAVWPVGTIGELYPWYTDTGSSSTKYIRFSYPSNYNLEHDSESQVSS